jgi:hypothetical protein
MAQRTRRDRGAFFLQRNLTSLEMGRSVLANFLSRKPSAMTDNAMVSLSVLRDRRYAARKNCARGGRKKFSRARFAPHERGAVRAKNERAVTER